MKIDIILNTNDPETVWNAFRFGLTSLYDGHSVKIFLHACILSNLAPHFQQQGIIAPAKIAL